MHVEYADIWAYPDRIEVWQQGVVTEVLPVEHPQDEGWAEFVTAKVVPAVRGRGWATNSWHRPRNNDELLATTFAWRDR